MSESTFGDEVDRNENRTRTITSGKGGPGGAFFLNFQMQIQWNLYNSNSQGKQQNFELARFRGVARVFDQ